MSRSANDYTDKTGKPNWCPGCGDFGIEMALKQAMAKMDLDPDQVTFVSGIGCGANMPYWFSTYGAITLHGRALPFATGAKLANHSQNVVVEGGDGDGYGIGMGHFVHAMRRNANITYLVGNNTVYGLTKGQVSPTAEKGCKSPSTPFGKADDPINPMAIALASGCTFVARGYSGNLPHLVNLIVEGFRHKGFAFIDILQPCVTYDKVHGFKYYQDRTYDLASEGHSDSDYSAAYKKAMEGPERLPIGIFYREQKEVYEEVNPVFQNGSLASHDISNVNIEAVYEEYS
jgi:2-oxoglutarate ferredoxin oxidoreductase subunit beta